MPRLTSSLLAITIVSTAWATNEHAEGGTKAQPRPSQHFVENKGQLPSQVLYRAEFGTASLFAEAGGFTWSMLQPDAGERVHEQLHAGEAAKAAFRLKGHAWKLRFEGANATPIVSASDKSATYLNYFLGNDHAKWAGHVGVYGEIEYAGVWNGVDLRLHTTANGGFKYDVLLSAGADVNAVRFAYEGLNAMDLDAEGRLVMTTSVGDVTELAPVAWYADGAKEAVECRFTLKASHVGFAFASGTDVARPIVIDPALIASTLSGTGDIGTTQNYGHSATYDEEGNIYTGAICFGQGYPATTGAFDLTFGGGFGVDIAVSKLNQAGTDLIYATYLGGGGGDYPHSLVVTPTNELTVYGTTDSGTDFPVSTNAFQSTFGGGTDIVVTKFTSDCSDIIGSTFVGGGGSDGRNSLTGNYGDSYRGEIISDADGNILVSSCGSTGFPTTTGAYQTAYGGGDQDGVAFKLSPDLSTMVWSTYIGTSANEMCFGLKISSDGSVYVGGATSGTFPTTAGAYQPASAGGNDAIVCHLSTDGTTMLQATYFGVTGNNEAFFLQTDGDDDVYIYGKTETPVPIQPAGTYGEATGLSFVAEFDPTLSVLKFSTAVASSDFGAIVPVAFLVDYCDHIYISGYSAGSSMVITPNALYTTGGFYLAVYNADMTGMLYATYYEGAGHVDGGTSRFDRNGVVYQAVCTGGGFPTTPDAWSSTQPSGWDVGVFKIDFEQDVFTVSIGASQVTGCAPAEFILTAQGGADQYDWDLGGGGPLVPGDSLVLTYTDPGTYVITLIGSSGGFCPGVDTTTITLVVSAPSTLLPSFTIDTTVTCTSITLSTDNTTQNGTSYTWNFGDGDTSTEFEPTHSYDGPGDYTVTLTAEDPVCANGATVSIELTIPPPSMPYTLPSPVPICDGGSIQLDAGGGYDSYNWSTSAVTRYITVDEVGSYLSTVTNGFCEGTDTIQVVNAPEHPPVADQVVCPNDSGIVGPSYGVQQILWSTGATSPLILVDEGEYWFAALDNLGCPVRDTLVVERIAATQGTDFVPNVFSPNADGYNDYFEVQGAGLGAFSMQVFNRWGMKMYETSDWQKGWNGKRDNQQDAVPDGTYFYIISYMDRCVEQGLAEKHGHLTLLR